MIPFAIVVAMDEALGIGKSGQLPWSLSADLKHFRDITMEGSSEGCVNAVIMGRKTWDSLPEKYRPLPGRRNIIISRQQQLSLPAGVVMAGSLPDALKTAQTGRKGKIFVIGGSQIFNEAVRLEGCVTIYATHVLQKFDCDVFFPDCFSEYQLLNRSLELTENRTAFYFAHYRRKS